MISRIDLTGDARASVDPRDVLPRAAQSVELAVEQVRPLCDDVRRRGAVAVREITARFDGVDVESARVPATAIRQAVADLDPALRKALDEAVVRARRVHEAQVPEDVTVDVIPGGQVTEKWIPVRRVGLYVPGGLVAYPSSVVMNVVPAQIAGVASIAVASPPQRENGGLPNPTVLAACGILGIDEVYAVGGAQAVAMFAYGTDDCLRVDVVSGPGNVYVAAAKRLLKGVIGIDSEAGPTEIGILADAGADPRYLAADLIAQAEHDENASCLLVTESSALLDAVDREVADQLTRTRHVDRVRTALSKQSAFVLVDDLEQGLEIVDEWAAEHLEVMTADAAAVAARVRTAGAVFVGAYSPVSLGDYLAGSNHVLPTGGTARHTGGLSVHSFLRGIHVIEYDREALATSAPHIDALGAAEDLQAHVAAVRIRIPRDA
jgi:histidinol dehydrogenase